MTTPTTPAARNDGLALIKARVLESVFDDLGVGLAKVRTLETPPGMPATSGASAIVGVPRETKVIATCVPAMLDFARANVAADGTLVVFCIGERTSEELAALRNALWPEWHVVAHYKTSDTGILRVALDEKRELKRSTGMKGIAVVARPRAAAFAPEATIVKFDKNAAGWNGNPGGPGYRHFRWMRRYVALFAGPVTPERVLDFGCGAGWVGIEAALAAPHGKQPELCAFDPSPELVRIATENAAAAGIARFEGRTGFGENPPFPAVGEALFDLVLSSGVISFSGDIPRWLDGLVSTLAPGGTLVIGDIHRESVGMRERRTERPLLPMREMNAQVREEVRLQLEARGLVFEAWCGYQLSQRLPQLNHLSATRLGGALDPLLVWWNARASKRELASGSRHQDRFDSWVMRLRRP
ncbi:MAG: class I SAM-dependent methyltransferase [Planctomycetes bacterium]|nr:class I SAM-dependent methyltransferase [Planctomycetota bacterium]